MKKYSFLALTDHRRHSKENSLYALMAKLASHPQCDKIDIASRGNLENAPFFQTLNTTKLLVHQADESFSFQEDGKQFLENLQAVDLTDYDIILLRLPRPVSDEFLSYLAHMANDKIIINHPLGIKNTSTKAFLSNFPDYCPPMKLCYSIEAILEYAKQFPIVIKPLREYGGKGIAKITQGRLFVGNQEYPILSYLQGIQEELERDGFLAMKFLKNVSQGDKRIIVVNGQILAASLRLPAPDSWLCNVAQGGKSILAEITPEENDIIQAISPKLLKEGILIFGADTLVDDDGKRVLSEINTLSIGGFPQAEKQTGRPVLQQTIDLIFDAVQQNYANKYSNHRNL